MSTDPLVSVYRKLGKAERERDALSELLVAERKYREVVEPEYNTLVVLIADLCRKDFLEPCCVMCHLVNHDPGCPLGQAVEFFRKMKQQEIQNEADR